MIFASSGIPVRLFYDIPDFTTDKGVQAEIYRTGTSSGGEVLVETVNLAHLATGRYSALWTPPNEEQTTLSIRYIVYTDTGYGTKSPRYDPASEQMVLNSGVGVGGGGTRWNITDHEVSRLVKALKKVLPKQKDIKIPKVDIPDYSLVLGRIEAGMGVESTQNTSKIVDKIKGVVDTVKSGFKQENAKIDDVLGLVSENTKDIKKSIDDADISPLIKSGFEAVHKQVGRLDFTTDLAPVLNEIKEAVSSVVKTRPELQTFFDKQNKVLTEYVSSVVEAKSLRTQNTVLGGIVGEVKKGLSGSSRQTATTNRILGTINKQVSRNDKKLEALASLGISQKKELVTTVQNNSLALSKIWQRQT